MMPAMPGIIKNTVHQPFTSITFHQPKEFPKSTIAAMISRIPNKILVKFFFTIFPPIFYTTKGGNAITFPLSY